MAELITPEKLKPISQKMMDAGMTEHQVNAEFSFACQIISQSKQLMECDLQSVMKALVNLANVKLTLNPVSREAYLQAKWNNRDKGYYCVVEPSYIGLQKLLLQQGQVKNLITNWVHENDKFDIDLGDDHKPVTHKIALKDRGVKYGVYCMATLADGRKMVEWVPIDEIYLIRDRAESWKAFEDKKISNCPWNSDFGEMGRKTVIKRFYKYLPKGDNRAVEEAIAIDNEDYGAEMWQLQLIENLLRSAHIDEKTQSAIDREIANISRQRAADLITFLKDNQVKNDVRHNGGTMGMKDLGKAVADAVDNDRT